MDDPDREDGGAPFELEAEPEPEVPTPAVPPPAPPPPRRAAPPPARPADARPPAAPAPPSRAEEDSGGPLAFLDARRRRRLRVYVPVMLASYVLIGWFFADGNGVVWFALAGLFVGVFAAWRRRGEVLLGSVAAAAGFAASMLAVHFPLFFVVVPTGIIGFLAGIDDRLRNS